MSSKNHEKSDYNLSLDLLSVSSMSHALYARRSGVIGKVTIEGTYTSWLIHTHTHTSLQYCTHHPPNQ